MIKKRLGENIRQLRKQSGLSQKKAAFCAGFTPSYWGYLERGQKNPSLEVIDKVAATLGVKAYLLLIESPGVNLPDEQVYLIHLINDMGHKHIQFISTVLWTYFKTHSKKVKN